MKPSFGSYILDKAEHLPLLPQDIHNHVIHPYLGSGHVVLLAQIQTAGTGLNLQFMDRIIFTSSWWTAALMDQAVGRIVRLGQKKQVHVHHLTLKEDEAINIDEYINERVEVKRDLCTELLAAANHSL
jgi:SNF2 family DNA or RNA helicase